MAWTTTNKKSVTLNDGVVVTYPKVALAYSFGVIDFAGTALHAGKLHTVICNGVSVGVILDKYGKGSLSLLPFICQAVINAGAMTDPLGFDSGEDEPTPNKMRGLLSEIKILVQGATSAGDSDVNVDKTIMAYYIFGDYAPTTPPTEYWRTYDSENDTPMNYDDDGYYTYNALNPELSGVPISLSDFQSNWARVVDVRGTEPTGDFTIVRTVAQFFGKDEVFRDVTWHFAYDCRTENIVKVRWLDHEGNINQRKFTVGGISQGGAVGDSWNVPHNTKELVNNYDVYWHGADLWQRITPQSSITLGDDAIPMNQYTWLKELATAVCVQVLVDNVWHRANITGGSIDADPRKSTFNMSFSLNIPTYEVQDF